MVSQQHIQTIAILIKEGTVYIVANWIYSAGQVNSVGYTMFYVLVFSVHCIYLFLFGIDY